MASHKLSPIDAILSDEDALLMLLLTTGKPLTTNESNFLRNEYLNFDSSLVEIKNKLYAIVIARIQNVHDDSQRWWQLRILRRQRQRRR
jgi:hypothetical protein